MTVRDWREALEAADPAWPVLFYNAADTPLEPDSYCGSLAVRPSRYWENAGWHPCILVWLERAS